MSKFLESMKIAQQVGEMVQACEMIYGDRWPEVKAKHQKILQDHHMKHKTNSLLASAIQLSKDQDERLVLVLIGSSVK